MESSIVRHIRAEIARRAGWVFKVHGEGMQANGIPDLVACIPCPDCRFARFVAFETKTKTGVVSRLQERIHDEIRRARGTVAVPTSLAEALPVLDAIQERAVCWLEPEKKFLVNADRVQKALKVFADNKKRLTEDQVLHVLYEVNLGEFIHYSEDGKTLVMQASDLQICAAAAAVAAAAELQGELVDWDNDEWSAE